MSEDNNTIDFGNKIVSFRDEGSTKAILTFNQEKEVNRIVEEIITNCDEATLFELFQGSNDDVDRTIRLLTEETRNVLFGLQGYVSETRFDYVEKLNKVYEETLRVEHFPYFLCSVFDNFDINWHHLEWAYFAQNYDKISVEAARDHGKSYLWSNAFPIWKMYRFRPAAETSKIRKDLLLCERGALITNEKSLAMDLMEIMKDTIESNGILRAKLYPDKGINWGVEKLKAKTGARLMAKSYGSKFRGRHPGYIIVDDFLDESALYSADQRNKFINYFHSVLMNAVVKGGQVVVVGTPFHENDLYGDLKKKKNWRAFKYPSVYPDGRLLWNNRYTMKDLLDKRDDQGSLIFSREHLCRPVVSDSSIFPYELLKKGVVGTENYTLVTSVENFPIKFNRVVTGCDFAMSSNVGADYSVFMTWGIDDEDCMWLIHFWREKGKSFGQQIAKLKSINANFHPDVMYLESNQFQQIFVEVANDSGLPVVPHNTGVNKHSLEKGLPSVALLFERSKIKFPTGDENSKNVKDLVFSELSSVAWTDKGLQGVGEHDDTAMTIWQSSLAAKHVTTGIGIGFL